MRTILENGLTVVLDENHASRVAAWQLWVRVGSADETPEEAGLAHLHEHMLFKGTRRRGPGEVASAVESCGGEINAWTSFDQTVYHLVLPSDSVAEGLDILADLATDSVFEEQELAREIEVVCEEIRRAQDLPSRRVSRALFDLAYRTHPYRRPVLGFESSVRSFTRAQIVDFYSRHYTAGNMVLVGVGDFEEARALQQLTEAFARARPGPARKSPTRVPEARQQEARARVETAPIHEAYLAAGWHIPALRSDDIAALDLVSMLLGQGDSSRLVAEVKRERGLVNEVYTSAYTPQDPGLLIAGATLRTESLEPALLAILEEVERARREPFTDAELTRAKRMLEADTLFQRETVQGQARKLGFFETVAGHVDEEERYLARVAACSPEDLRSAAEKHLTPANLSLSLVAPEEAKADEALLLGIARSIDRARQATRGSPSHPYRRLFARSSGVRRDGIETERLQNGITLVVKPESNVPIVSFRAAWQGGLRAEGAGDNGINHLLARCLSRGTESRSARQLAQEIEDLSGAIGGVSGRNSFGVQGEFLSADLRSGFELFCDVMRRAALAEDEVIRERALVLEDIRSRDDNPTAAAFSLFSSALYDRHPYRLEVTGTEASMTALDGPRLKSYLRQRYRSEGLVLAAAGDVEPDQMRRLVEGELGAGPDGLSPRLVVEEEPPLTEPREVRKRLDRQQAHLVVGFRGTTLLAPERHALSVLSAVLSGQGGRLFLELRDKKSLAYSVTSITSEGLDPGYFAVYIGTSPEKVDEAKKGIRVELERVTQERIAAAELDRAKRHLTGAHEIALQRLSARAAVLALDECYGLGAESHLEHAERIRAVTADDVQEVARRIIDFDRQVTALVSPAA